MDDKVLDHTQQALASIKQKWPRLFFGLVHHRTTSGDHLTFGDKPWLIPIFKDNNSNMVIIKCSQVYMTEHALCAMFTFAHQGKRGMYVLPSKEHRRTFVADRINRMKDFSILYDEAIKNKPGEADSNVYKTIFSSGWKFVGSNVRKDFFEFPCDVIFFDEFDELHQDNIIYAYDRVANTKRPIIWKFGNPTFPDVGIDREWQRSDQREWHVTCPLCGEDQILDWEKHFVHQDKSGQWQLRHPDGDPICYFCEQPFDRLSAGKWIPMRSEKWSTKIMHGYRITRLFTDKGQAPNDIVWLFQEKFLPALYNPIAMQNFWNNYLGQPYRHANDKVRESDLQQSAQTEPLVITGQPRCIMGVDQGKDFTCVISIVIDGIVYDVHYTNVKRWDDVRVLEETFNVVCTVVDASGGGYAETRDFIREKGHRWMAYYRSKDKIKDIYRLIHRDQTVETNRTEILDVTVGSLKRMQTRIKADYRHAVKGKYKTQMLAPNRIVDAGDRPIWTKGNDHFLHASAYRYLALLISGMTDSRTHSSKWHVKTQTEKKKEDSVAKVFEKGQIGTIGEKEKPEKKKGWHV